MPNCLPNRRSDAEAEAPVLWPLDAKCVIPWTVALQAPLSMEFSRQEYWSGLPFPSPGYFPTQGLNPALLQCKQILYQLSY